MRTEYLCGVIVGVVLLYVAMFGFTMPFPLGSSASSTTGPDLNARASDPSPNPTH